MGLGSGMDVCGKSAPLTWCRTPIHPPNSEALFPRNYPCNPFSSIDWLSSKDFCFSKLKQCIPPRPFVYLQVWLSARNSYSYWGVATISGTACSLTGRERHACAVTCFPALWYHPSDLTIKEDGKVGRNFQNFLFFLILQPEIICIKSTSCFVFLNSFRRINRRFCSDVAPQKLSSVFVLAHKARKVPFATDLLLWQRQWPVQWNASYGK